MAVIIINNATDDGDARIIGPFISGNAASNWAFRNLPLGMDWYWLPMESPCKRDLADVETSDWDLPWSPR
jgi:hypothetical protein